jgi:hypothetical protein
MSEYEPQCKLCRTIRYHEVHELETPFEVLVRLKRANEDLKDSNKRLRVLIREQEKFINTISDLVEIFNENGSLGTAI